MNLPAQREAERVAITVDEQGIAQVRLSRAVKLNALDAAMFDAIIAAGERLAAMEDLRCVVLSGEGKAFCSGLDLAMLGTLSGSDLQLAMRSHGNANRFQQVAMQWRALPVPVIAAVHGVCFGGGLQIAAGADIRVVAPDARLAVMELKWGIVPDMGHFVLWRGLVRDDVLRELTWTAREFSGDVAQALGFASHVDANPLARAMAIAQEIAAKDPAAIRAAKALFNGAADMASDAILLAESVAQDRLLAAKRG
jgi:enoyl-CoA hydratase/carnithine racemase